MLIIKKTRVGNSPVLSVEEVKQIVSSMGIALKNEFSNDLTLIIDGKGSIFEKEFLVNIFKGEMIEIAKYYVYSKTIKFAKDNLCHVEGKHVLEINEREDQCEIKILYECVTILCIKIKDSFIEFELMNSRDSFDTRMKLFSEQNLIEKINKLIAIGSDGLENINNFLRLYKEEMKLVNTDKDNTFYKVTVSDCMGDY